MTQPSIWTEHRYGTRKTSTFDLPTGGGSQRQLVEVTGRLLGFATTRHTSHNHEPDDTPNVTGVKCSACRWFEVHLFIQSNNEYIVHTAGVSTLAGETDTIRITRTRSPFEVVEILTLRRDGKATLPQPAARVLAQAAEFDDGITEAYINRAVA